MKKVMGLILLLGLATIVMPIMHAGVVTLTFEGLQDQESIDNYYNGGFGGSGSGPGPNYGIVFTSDSLALISSADGGSGNFSNNPSGDTIMFFLAGADTMDVAAGFNTGFSFFYSAAEAGSVSVYSGLDGTGTLLQTLALPVTPSPYTVWDPVGVTFAGTAESVVWNGSANYIGFDDVTLGSSTPGVPEPTSVLLFGTIMALVAIPVRKKLSARM
jgi:hypothetical protein